MIKENGQKGFTLLEIILVVTLLAILFATAAIYSQTAQVRNDIRSQANVMVSYLRLAQSNAQTGKDEFNGIHLDAVESSYTLFEGESYMPSDSSNFEIEFPGTITIENISLNGGGVDIVFDSPNGTTDTYGSFSLNANQINHSLPITIDQIGKIDY